MTRSEFEQVVQEVLERIPDVFRYALENVAIVVEEEPEEAQPDEELLGLYEGTPLSDRGAGHTGFPDRIRIFRGPILRTCTNDNQVVREIRDTLIHELGHHMGLDDEEMPY